MPSILILLGCCVLLFSGVGLLVFIKAARLTNDDWEQHPHTRRFERELQRAEPTLLCDAPQSASHSRLGEI
jgi:hypothetical protein